MRLEQKNDKLLLIFILVASRVLVASCRGLGLLTSKRQTNNILWRNKVGKIVPRDQSPPILCRVYKESVIFSNKLNGEWDGENFKENFVCSTIIDGEESDVSYNIDLPPMIGSLEVEDAESGNFFINVYGSRLEADSIVGFSQSDLEVAEVPSIRRRVLQSSGRRKVLVLRVSLDDAEPAFTADEFQDRIFGFDDVTMQSQFFKCSAGKLRFEPAMGNGILEVRIPESSISNFTTSTMLSNAAQVEAANILSLAPGGHVSSLADHIMICLPPGTGNWIAAAATNHWRSVYNDRFCGILSASMHEIGHNLGLLHANTEEGSYQDFTSYMSAGYHTERYPQKCFNGQNHDHLGWFNDRTIALEAIDEPVVVNLASFVDYRQLDKDNDDVVLISIDHRYFLQFNQAKSFNWEVEEKRNQITIVEQLGGGTNMLAGIDMDTPTFQIRNYEARSSLVFSVCDATVGQQSSVDKMLIVIGRDSAPCPGPPTPWPSHLPTILPTHLPSLNPTPEPSIRPSTQEPTDLPTWDPSTSPSDFPSPKPTVDPTDTPTSEPSIRPSTEEPTSLPTGNPSRSPSDAPSSQPTVAPTDEHSTEPSMHPSTEEPTSLPSWEPSPRPSDAPSSQPTAAPTNNHSTAPSMHPSTKEPTSVPSQNPSLGPSYVPSFQPTADPTNSPSDAPSSRPSTDEPTSLPSDAPSSSPTVAPTNNHSTEPSIQPSTEMPTHPPSDAPSSRPTTAPTVDHTTAPSMHPTTEEPTTFPSWAHSSGPSDAPSPRPTTDPTTDQSVAPSSHPSTGEPTRLLSDAPRSQPTADPTTEHSVEPSIQPSTQEPPPSLHPAADPTNDHSTEPSIRPITEPPTTLPTWDPSLGPSEAPSPRPTADRTKRYSTEPDTRPSTEGPSSLPQSDTPNSQLTAKPTNGNSTEPSVGPSNEATTSIPSDTVSSSHPTVSIAPSHNSTTNTTLAPSTIILSNQPSIEPSSGPTKPSTTTTTQPSNLRTASPSILPSTVVSSSASFEPTILPSEGPSEIPSLQPTEVLPPSGASSLSGDVLSTINPTPSLAEDPSSKPSSLESPTTYPSESLLYASNPPSTGPTAKAVEMATNAPSVSPPTTPAHSTTESPTAILLLRRPDLEYDEFFDSISSSTLSIERKDPSNIFIRQEQETGEREVLRDVLLESDVAADVSPAVGVDPGVTPLVEEDAPETVNFLRRRQGG